MKQINHGSLFSGIGGFDLAAEWMGWNNVFHCEWMPFPRQILKYHFPNSISYEDITKTDFTIHRGTIDVLTGGFPCQPYSVAGKRLGKEDERHLWPEMLRAIREIEPRFVVGENVRGLVNWNGGMVFDEVQANLEDAGYEVIPFIIPACAVGAPHRRDRVWFVAHRKDDRHTQSTGVDQRGKCEQDNGAEIRASLGSNSASGIASHALSSATRPPGEGKGIEGNGSGNNPQPQEWGTKAEQHIGCANVSRNDTYTDSPNNQTRTQRKVLGQQNRQEADGFRYVERGGKWQNFPTQSPICGGDDGLPTELDGITFSKWRNESIKGYGNAVVPQVVYQIFKAIQHSMQ